MYYTPNPEESEVFVFDVDSLYAYFTQVTDHRDPRGIRYSLGLILTLMMLAKLAGEDHPTGIEQWAQARAWYLLPTLGVDRERLPSHNTYRRALANNIDPYELHWIVTAYLTQDEELLSEARLICLDGKTLRGTIPAGASSGVHLLACYLPEVGVVLMQVQVDGHENEISAARRVLNCLDLRGKIVMGDALLTQRGLSLQIQRQQGEYLWVVKQNHPLTLAHIEKLFSEIPFEPDFETAKQVNKGHGRIESRTITTSCLLNDYLDWPGLAQVFKLERHTIRTSTGQVQEQIVYGLTSLAREQVNCHELLDLSRGYWQIENGLHYRRDVTLNEDATRMTHPAQAEVIAILNNLVVALGRRTEFHYLPEARRHFCAHPQDALEILLGPPL
jgi:predicted transposase YbfD/YdcC